MAFVIPFVIAAAGAVGDAAAGAAAYAGLGAAAGSAAGGATAGAVDAGFMAAEAVGTAGELTAGTAAAGGMSTLTAATLATTATSAAVGGYGAVKQGEAQAAAAKYNSAVEGQNAAVSGQNANIAEQSGEAQANLQGQKTKAAIGATLTGQGASGVDVAGGSAVNVRDSERALGEIDSLTIRSNAARDAFGYRVKSKSEEGQSAVSAFEAANDTTGGKVAGASTFLGGLGSASSEYQKYKLSSGL